MNEQIEGLKKIAQAEPYKVIISKPLVSGEQYRKIVVEKGTPLSGGSLYAKAGISPEYW